MDSDFLRDLVIELRGGGLEVSPLQPANIPQRAFNRSRGQYRASSFLELAGRYDDEYVLVVTSVDLYAEPLNFVFGQAEMGGRSAVISLKRLRSADHGTFVQRALKEALHELGHAAGLGHCDSEECVMHFSNTLADTDRKGPGYCESCRSSVTTQVLWHRT